MKQTDRTEQTLTDAAALSAIEGSHRAQLKRELQDWTSRAKEDVTMSDGGRRKRVAFAICGVLIFAVACVTTTYTVWHYRLWGEKITMKEPQDVARTIFTALQEEDFAPVEALFPTKAQLASVFPADHPIITQYDILETKLKQDFDRCLTDFPSLADAVLLQINGDYGELPMPADPSKMMRAFDNAHMFVQVGDLVYDIKLDEILEIDGAWWIIELPGEYGTAPPKSIDEVRELQGQ